MVTDINPDGGGCSPSNLTNLNGKSLLFTAYSPATGWRLWSYDSTDGASELPNSPSMSVGATQEPVNDADAPLTTLMIDGVDYAYFDGMPDSHNCPGCGLYRTDGTSVELVAPGMTVYNITASNGMLFFDGPPNETSFYYSGVWESDGVPGGSTQQFTGFWGDDLTDVNGTLFFAGDDTAGGSGGGNFKLWTITGTTIQQVTDMWPGHPDIFGGGDTLNLNGTFYFQGADGTHAGWGAAGGELFQSNGTAAGTTLVNDIDPGPGGSRPDDFTNLNGLLLFRADSFNNDGEELWRSDGTAAGTWMVEDIYPGVDALRRIGHRFGMAGAGPDRRPGWIGFLLGLGRERRATLAERRHLRWHV